MSSSVNIDIIKLSSGNYRGRVLELIDDDGRLNESFHKKKNYILVLIEDQIFSLKIKDSFNVSVGSIISFKINNKNLVENLKTEQISNKFDVKGDVLRWRRPSKNPSRMEFLRIRHQIIRGLREWFDNNDFIETETPVLVKAPSPEFQLSPIRTESGFLITSPELQMKRLLAGGFEKIYQVSRCFRNDEIGEHHNPEFTMLEWYRTGETLERLINDIEQFVIHLTKKLEIDNNCKHIPQPPWRRTTVRDLFEKHLGIFLDGSEKAIQLMEKAKLSGHEELLIGLHDHSKLTNSLAYEQIFTQLWKKIEKDFIESPPLFVCEWPLPLPSFARESDERSGFVDRVELFSNGIELANGYCELTDVVEQRLRFKEYLGNRHACGYESVPLDKKFLSCLENGLPKSSGMALGVDRLIMWICSAKHIRDVLCFSNDEV